MTTQVQAQYESWPYPAVPRVASVPREHLWQININWIRTRCGLAPLKTPPRIWIAGCGTFEPYLFSQANPDSNILATDLSFTSLDFARKRLRWHRARNVSLEQLDLSNPNAFPEGTFDFIECYGVLMCLPNPQETLKAIGRKLKPDGVLRIMVYPHYSRQRIFQIQKLAKLLGLSFQKAEHPALLRSLMKKLPKSHPLSYAFNSYWDSSNLPGIVDGFLHASDRGFTGIELCSMFERADLLPKFCFHRPWGQPHIMSEKLSDLGSHSFAFWLHYLDLWQSLRTNFTLCLTKKELETQNPFPTEKHPLFDLRNPHLSPIYKTKLVSLALSGTQLPSRTAAAPLRLNATEIKNILKGNAPPDSTEAELLLAPQNHFLDTQFDPELSSISPKNHFVPRQSTKLLNPMYDYLFDAYTFKDRNAHVLASDFPYLNQQIKIWETEAYPLEDDLHPFGLTPFGTYRKKSKEINDYLQDYLNSEEISFSEFYLPKETEAFDTLRGFLKSAKISQLPDDSASALRQLWILLFSYERLFLD